MFKTRLLSGIVLVILLFAFIIPGGYVLAGGLLLLSLIAHRELMKTCKNTSDGFSKIEILGYIGIIAYYAVMLFTKDRTYLLMTLFAILMAYMFLYVFSFPKYNAQQIMSSFFSVIYGPVMLTFVYLTREHEYGAYLVWMIFISSWVCDIFAYCVGMLFGKHKLAPVLSPKKSIEGALGGIAGSVLAGALYAEFFIGRFLPDINITVAIIIISAVGAIVSQVGDLAASAIKRNQDIKDYGKLIPGHGGVMDRFDSVIFTAPMIYLLTLIMING